VYGGFFKEFSAGCLGQGFSFFYVAARDYPEIGEGPHLSVPSGQEDSVPFVDCWVALGVLFGQDGQNATGHRHFVDDRGLLLFLQKKKKELDGLLHNQIDVPFTHVIFGSHFNSLFEHLHCRAVWGVAQWDSVFVQGQPQEGGLLCICWAVAALGIVQVEF
jgi:hypothetical protein